MERFGDRGGLREHRRPTVDTAELRAFDRSVPDAIPRMWHTFNTGARWSARGRVHAMNAGAGPCDARLRGTVVTGECECAEVFALTVAETVLTVRERFVDDPHYLPEDGHDFAETLRFTFDNGGAQNVKRELRLARCALAAEGSLRDKAIWAALPDAEHRELLVASAALAGWFQRYRPEHPEPFYRRLAETVAARVGSSLGDLTPRIPAMFETVREIANATARARVRVCSGELLPWFDGTVLHPLTDHTGDVEPLVVEDPDDDRAVRDVAATPRDHVEREALAAVETAASGLHRVSPRAFADLASSGDPAAPVVAHLLAAYLPPRSDRVERVRRALARAADRGLLPAAVVGEVLASPARLDAVLAGLADAARELG